ncbi:hypothetical protein ETQ85_24445 [Zoogloea oleivorans]|uniref:DUF4258 domain-containing protein n=1 Tax=Zoogloea oleivorans TaxID=1552750 RepID=A0A6C2CBH1_9RHOO|nr:DUF4258 domain-containing protein [Zoogloea oleivorans]TYC51378.1 hypothetical protein ETQ85_24445 [Zoogloea oleivorans]
MADRYMTDHARQRRQQRGISELQIELLRTFGEDLYQKGGECLCFIPEKKLIQLRNALDKLGNVAMIKGDAGQVVTVMHVNQRIRHTQHVA